MASMVYFDTLEYVETLKSAGFSEVQAKAFVKVQQESLSECLDTTLATKADIQNIKTEIQEVKFELKDMKADLTWLKWMFGMMMAGMGSLILKAFFN